MTDLAPWIVANASVTTINAAVLGYLSWRSSSSSLGWWSAAWTLATIAVSASAFVDPDDVKWVAPAILCTAYIASALCFLKAAYAFAGRPLPRAWPVACAACAAAGIALAIRWGPAPGMTPLVLLHCAGSAASGIVVIRSAPKLPGAWLTGGSLVLISIHTLDYPLTLAYPTLAPWGYLVMVMLESTAALGIVILHYEHVRGAWLQTQEKLHNSRRVEALGRIAGGVAHDFNNILTIVHAEIDMLKASDNVEDRDESLVVVMEAVTRATRLTTQLLTFGRQSSVKPTDVDAREVVESTLDLLRRVTPKQIEIVFESDQRTYPITTDRSLLEQVVLNLVSNAKDALPGGGKIEVGLLRASDPIPSLQLSVRDNGEGMSADVLDRVYEPFFTTKEVGDGTGLGLAAVHGAVAQLNARISVKSKEHHGTTFEVLLPL